MFSKSFEWDLEFFGYMDLSREWHSTMRPSIFKTEVVKILVNIFWKTLLKFGDFKNNKFLKNNSNKSMRKINVIEYQGIGHIAVECPNKLKKNEKVMQLLKMI